MKIVIIGNSGSGKTWVAHVISHSIAAPLVHLDEIFWEPGGFDEKRSAEVVGALVEHAKRKDSWIAEGVFGELAQKFLEDADWLVWLDLHRPICRRRLEARGSESKRNLDREQSQAGLERLLEWASTYYERNDMRSFPGHKQLFDGFAGLHTPSAELPFSPCIEIGWRLAYPYWGKGLATEAAEEVLRIGFEALHFPEIVSFTVVSNRRSRAVMERLGMQDQEMNFDHPGIPADNTLRRHCLYKLSRRDWSRNAV